MNHVVADTNIVLDVVVFEEERCHAMREALQADRLRLWATSHMRDELERVLDYPAIAKRRVARGLNPTQVLAIYDGWVDVCPTAPKVRYTCKDPDDQCFLDLAAQQQCPLVSKDAAVLAMARRMATLGVEVSDCWDPVASP